MPRGRCGPGRLVWRGLAGCALLLAFCLLSPRAFAASEEEIKAAFLTKFGLYITWPAGRAPSADKPYVIGLLGDVSFASMLEQRASEESERGHAMQVRRLRTPGEAAGVHLLFISASEADAEGRLLPALAQCACLLVGESERFLDLGGMIRLALDQKRIRFDVNVAAAERAGLKVSAKMLQHARTVQGGMR
ncbi:MAG: YfiR family protein [Gammaproteobacteria bacterium]|nr:YfiR family protein [Gammaproteobacteria bacterium]